MFLVILVYLLGVYPLFVDFKTVLCMIKVLGEDFLREGFCSVYAERVWLPSGLVCAVPADSSLLHHGSALVCGRDRPVHQPRQLSEAGVGVRCAW